MCAILETAIALLFIGMNLLVPIIVVGTNLISTLYCSITMCIAMCGDILQYIAHAILLNVSNTDIAGLILPGGNNIEMLPNHSLYNYASCS